MGLLSNMSVPKANINSNYTKKIQIDLADKLNWEVTVNLLIVATLIVTNLKHFINKLISCTVPIHFSDNQEVYVNEVCRGGQAGSFIPATRIYTKQCA